MKIKLKEVYAEVVKKKKEKVCWTKNNKKDAEGK